MDSRIGNTRREFFVGDLFSSKDGGGEGDRGRGIETLGMVLLLVLALGYE